MNNARNCYITFAFIGAILGMTAFVLHFTNRQTSPVNTDDFVENLQKLDQKPKWCKSADDARHIMKTIGKKYNCKAEFEPNDDRYEVVNNLVSELKLKKGSKLLDFGGSGSGASERWSNDFDYTCLNLRVCTGTTCKADLPCDKYDGLNIPYSPNNFDVIIVESVLHHASANTIPLLKHLYNITKRNIIIGEDMSSLHASQEWQQQLFNHDPNGVFRSIQEWVELFVLVGFTVKKITGLARLPYEGSKQKIFRKVSAKKDVDTGGTPAMVFFTLEK